MEQRRAARGEIVRERGHAVARRIVLRQQQHRKTLADQRHRAVANLGRAERSEEHTSELQSLMRISYAVFCLKKKKNTKKITTQNAKTSIILLTQQKTHTTHKL